jgi:hypothetical protein
VAASSECRRLGRFCKSGLERRTSRHGAAEVSTVDRPSWSAS